MSSSKILFWVFLFLGVQLKSGFSQELRPEQIDSIVEKSRTAFRVPGMAVAVIKDGKTISKKGYGITSVETQKPVDTHTLFGIASNTKAFISAALAQLVDDGKISWDTKVIDIIPEFKLQDPFVTSEFTVRDLLIHNSGYAAYAGDLLWYPTSNTASVSDLIHSLSFLSPVASFRSTYAYNNIFYSIAGEVITRVAQTPYDEYINRHIFKPLKMERAIFNLEEFERDSNRIDAHKIEKETPQVISKKPITETAGPAGGIFASLEDLTKWVKVRLDYGKYGTELQDSIFSKKQAQEMWTPQNIIKTGKGNYNTHFSTYGLGWFLNDVNGYFQAYHTGGLYGMVSEITLLPELNLGIIVVTNQQSRGAYKSISRSIKDAYFGITDQDRIKQYLEEETNAKQKADLRINTLLEELKKADSPASFQNNIAGIYSNPWLGKAEIVHHKDGLFFQLEKSSDLSGKLSYYKGTTYAIEWSSDAMEKVSFLNFKLDTKGNTYSFEIESVFPNNRDFDDTTFIKTQ